MLSRVGLVHAFILVPINIKYIKLYLGIFVVCFLSVTQVSLSNKAKNLFIYYIFLIFFNINVMLHTAMTLFPLWSMKMSTRAKSFKLGW